MLKRIIFKNPFSSFYQQSLFDIETPLGLRRNNFPVIFLKKVIVKLNYVSQNLKYLSHSKIQNYHFHSKFTHRNNLPLVDKNILTDQKVENWGGQEAYNTIIFIKENYKEIIHAHKSILVFFSAEWCNHCKQLKHVYGKVSLMALKDSLPIKFAFFDVNIKPEIAVENGVVGVPTIKYYKNGQFISNYKGKRTVDDLYNFAKDPPTQFVESTEADF